MSSVDPSKSVSSAPASKKGKQSVPKLEFTPKPTSPDLVSSPNNKMMRSIMSFSRPYSWRDNDWEVRNAKYTGDVEEHLDLYDFFYVNKRLVYK